MKGLFPRKTPAPGGAIAKPPRSQTGGFGGRHRGCPQTKRETCSPCGRPHQRESEHLRDGGWDAVTTAIQGWDRLCIKSVSASSLETTEN